MELVMNFPKASLIRKSIIFLVATVFSISAMAIDFSQTQRLANQGDAVAQYDLGFLYHKGKEVSQDYTKAVEWYKKAASQGNAKAQTILGVFYHEGKELPQDYTKAKQYFEKAASQGNADAKYHLGGMYYLGKGVRKNDVVAKKWFGKACEVGDQGGCDAYKTLKQRGIK